MSHPSWVRGLKHGNTVGDFYWNASHPSWVRGLKLMMLIILTKFWRSRTPRGCVD